VRVVLTGGGTGGHVYPALAVGHALKQRGHEVAYVGADGLEARVVPEHFPFHRLRAGKLDRTGLRPRELVKAGLGLWDGFRLVRRLKPDAVLATGGFAAFPFAFAAETLGVPVFLHEQNARLGLANRWLAPRARRLFLAVPFTLPPALEKKAETVGMPIVEKRVEREAAKRALGLDPDRPVLLVLGGSQGAKVFNEKLPELLGPFLERFQVLHQTGPRWLEATRAPGPGYHLAGYLNTVLAWSAADLAVTRAGAMTLAEAAYYRVPLVLVPLPTAADDHQRKNARLYAEAGAAVYLEQLELERLPEVLLSLDEARLEAMRNALARFDPRGSAERIAARIEELW